MRVRAFRTRIGVADRLRVSIYNKVWLAFLIYNNACASRSDNLHLGTSSPSSMQRYGKKTLRAFQVFAKSSPLGFFRGMSVHKGVVGFAKSVYKGRKLAFSRFFLVIIRLFFAFPAKLLAISGLLLALPHSRFLFPARPFAAFPRLAGSVRRLLAGVFGKKNRVRLAVSGEMRTFAPQFCIENHINSIKFMMNQYETVFIMTPVLSDQQMKETVAKFKGFLVESGAEIINEEEWGLKSMAYPIQKKSTGFYELIEFKAEPSVLAKLETAYRRDERVIRYLTVKLEKYAALYAEKRRNKFKKED